MSFKTLANRIKTCFMITCCAVLQDIRDLLKAQKEKNEKKKQVLLYNNSSASITVCLAATKTASYN